MIARWIPKHSSDITKLCSFCSLAPEAERFEQTMSPTMLAYTTLFLQAKYLSMI